MDTILNKVEHYVGNLDQASFDCNFNSKKIKICLQAQEILKDKVLYDLYTDCVNNLPCDTTNKNIEDLKRLLNDRGARASILGEPSQKMYLVFEKIRDINDYCFLSNLYKMFN